MVIRRVLLDAFGTVFSPREPVFHQYTSVARSFGLQVEEGRVKDGFKQAFKSWAKSHPLYGKRSTPPLDAAQWWTGVIEETFRRAGVPESDFGPVSARLCDTLVHRFWGEDGYALHDDVHPLLQSLHALGLPPPVIVSNTDPSVSLILRALGTMEGQTDPLDAGIREREVWTTWELEQEKGSAAFWEEVLVRLRATARDRGEDELKADAVLVVGDEAVSDYEAPRQVGMQSLLLRRLPVGEHARSSYSDNESAVAEAYTIASLLELVEFVKQVKGA
ncbi:hypothetical protein JCM8208_003533 [Rhodotorula glutinis]